LSGRDADAFLARVRHRLADAVEALALVYGGEQVPGLVGRCLSVVRDAAAARPEPLRRLDHRREIDAGWFQSPRMVGYACYVDRFAGSLAAVGEHLDYLRELGVTYLHLLPLLRTRVGDDDGGYAVVDYGAVDASVGTMDELEALAAELRARDISLCVDVVLNHTAREHEWATRARAGDPRYRAYYHVFADRADVDRYEATLPEVFPASAPGSFTRDEELDAWVWTTFNAFQWDLNYANPDVFVEMLAVMVALANRGVEVLRLDAVAFLWKRLGTDCQNQPEVHRLLQAFRALLAMAAPATICKAEAVVAPDALVPYLGAHERFRPECDLAYHNQLMVLLWNSVATGDARLATTALERMAPAPPSASWCTYVRCHDDIGWAVRDEDAAAVGWDGGAHRRFLADFYAGRFPGSFARGADFERNARTGDVRTSGTASSLCGIEAALASGDADALDRGERRLVLLYSVAMSFGGIPLVWMGDELALVNDCGSRTEAAHAQDNRWLHRPAMDWTAAQRRHDESLVEGRAFAWMARLARVRRGLVHLDASAPAQPWWSGHDHVLAFHRRHPRAGPFLALVNMGTEEASVPGALLAAAGVTMDDLVLARDPTIGVHGDAVVLPGLSFGWWAA
jgi:amylosucrase